MSPTRWTSSRRGTGRNKDIGPPNDVGFENFDWPTVDAVRRSPEELGIGYRHETSMAGRFCEYPGDPLVTGLGTPVTHTGPA